MPGVKTTNTAGFSVTLRGLGKVRNMFARIAKGASHRTELHMRYGIQALRWADKNFRDEGGLTGSPWAKLSPSTIARRRKGSSRVLQDTGQLRQSYTMKFGEDNATVGTNKFYAVFHEKGVDPFEIRRGERVYKHPGLPVRRMLPTTKDMLPVLLKTTINYVKELEQRGESMGDANSGDD